MNQTPSTWRGLSGKRYAGELVDILRTAIEREQAAGHRLKVCVGTDSQVYRDQVEYATVIVVLREGRGGFMFIRNNTEEFKPSIKERMLHEVSQSIEVAYGICELLDEKRVDLEVHADINTDPQFKSNPALKEAMGYIIGMGFVFKAKPEAFASTSCANKVV